ncbi:MAG TPA: MFS transporter, partial [Chloroflexota bacterium]
PKRVPTSPPPAHHPVPPTRPTATAVDSHPTPPWPPVAPLAVTRLPITLAGLLLTLMLAALDATIVATAMPRIVADLHGFDHYTWVTVAYLLTSTVSVPVVGKLADQYGRKPFLVLGTTMFVLSSLLCGLAASFDQLVGFRLLQGLGGGIITAAVFAAVPRLFSPTNRPRIVGLFTATYGLSSILGPLLGGLITDSVGWRAVFSINLPLGLVALALVLATYPADRPARARPSVDYWGAALLVGAATPILLALSLGGRDVAWGSPLMVGLWLVGVLCGLGLVWVERGARDPIVPLELLATRGVGVPLLGTVLMSAGFFAALLFTPLFVQGVSGRSASQSGSVLTPMMTAWVLASVVIGQLIARLGRSKPTAIVGLSIGGIGLWLMSAMGSDSGSDVVARNLIIVGFGLGSALPSVTIAAQNAVPLQSSGVATALSTFARAMGSTFASAGLGGVLAASIGGTTSVSVSPGVLGEGLHQTFLVAAALTFAGALVVTLQRESPLHDRAARR